MISPLDPRLWLAAGIALGVAYGGGRWQQSRADAGRYEAERTKAALSAAVDQVKAVERARTEEQRRTAAQTEIANAATKDLDRARGDARAAGDAADRLRARVAELLASSRAGKDSAAPGSGPAAGDPLGVLADVLERADRRAGILAEYADAARISGLACERAYDSLTSEAIPKD